MQILILKAMVVIAAGIFATAAVAQKVYKCADSYSQLPCPDGVVVDSVDPRTSAQKAQTDLAARRDAKTADAMEKARLAQEKRNLAANAAPLKTANVEAAKKTGTKQVKKKKKEPEYFTAQVPGAKKKPSSKKKSMLKEDLDSGPGGKSF